MRRVWLCCADCELPYSDDGFADFVVSDDIWAQITAEDAATILCANCMVRRAERLGVQSVGWFTSGPFAEAELEAAIDRVGRRRVFDRAHALGWTDGVPPKYVWWGIVRELALSDTLAHEGERYAGYGERGGL